MATKFSISAIFNGIDKISGPVKGIRKSIRGMVRSSRAGIRKLRGSFTKLSSKVSAFNSQISRATLAGVAGIVAMTVVGSKFELQLAIAGTKFGDAYAKGTKGAIELREAASLVGRTTEFTALDAAKTLDTLGLSGMSATQSMSVLGGIVDLATVAQVSLSDAATIGTKTLGAFNLTSKDSAIIQGNLTRVSDVLAATQNKTNVTMESMFETIRLGSATFQSLGTDIETFAALSGTLGNAAIDGTSAGTALRSMLDGVIDDKNAEMFQRLGVSIQDASKNMLPIIDILGSLESRLQGMGNIQRQKILTKLFGIRGSRAAIKLLDAGAVSIRGLRDELKDSGGDTEKLAKIIRDTTSGAFKEMISTVSDVAISMFESGKETVGWKESIESVTRSIRKNTPLIVEKFKSITAGFAENRGAILKWTIITGKVIAALFVLKTAIIAIGIVVTASTIIWAAIVKVYKAFAFVLKMLPFIITKVAVAMRFLALAIASNPIGAAIAGISLVVLLLWSNWGKLTGALKDVGAWDFIGEAVWRVVTAIEALLALDMSKLTDVVGLGGAVDFVSRNVIEKGFNLFDGDSGTPPPVVSPVTQSERLSRTFNNNTNQTLGINVSASGGAIVSRDDTDTFSGNLTIAGSGGL